MNSETLIAHLELGGQVFAANVEGLTHEDSLVHPQGGGNCLNWVLGHIVKARNDAIGLLGHTPPFPVDRFKRYGTGSLPLTIPDEAVPFEDLRADFVALREPLLAALRTVEPTVSKRPVPDSPTGNPEETIGSLIVATAFHEAYHLGQAGLLRRVLGKPRNLP